jgi:hypothetical protein
MTCSPSELSLTRLLAKVSGIIKEDGWNFPSSIQAFQAIWNSIPFQPGPHMEDRHVWKGNPSGQFTIDSAWELLRETRPANTIHHLLWFKGHIPCQSFILWLASEGHLHTIDRLHTVGSITNTACILCGMDIENHDH